MKPSSIVPPVKRYRPRSGMRHEHQHRHDARPGAQGAVGSTPQAAAAAEDERRPIVVDGRRGPRRSLHSDVHEGDKVAGVPRAM